MEEAFAYGRGVLPSATCRFGLDGAPGTRRVFSWCVPMPWLLVLMVWSLMLDGSDPTLRFVLGSELLPGLLVFSLPGRSRHWRLPTGSPDLTSPVNPSPGRPRIFGRSISKPFGWFLWRFVWNFHEFCHTNPDVDRAWETWCDSHTYTYTYTYKYTRICIYKHTTYDISHSIYDLLPVSYYRSNESLWSGKQILLGRQFKLLGESGRGGGQLWIFIN